MRTALRSWFAAHARSLPWRMAGTSAWGILVSEVMSQQTPMSRVAPRWEAWMEQWPLPADLAQASPAEVLLAWDSLGYPRRALRLQETARVITFEHGGQVPHGEEVLRGLPGVGEYTAAAVTSFAHGRRTTVLDVNIRRVLHRVFAGCERPAPSLSRREHAWAAELVPQRGHVEWNAGAMEFGALICTSRSPDCGACPVASVCAWAQAGHPVDPQARPRTQAWEGTDRQLRGAIMAVLRMTGEGGIPVSLLSAPELEFDADAHAALPTAVASAVARVRELSTAVRTDRLVQALIADGLAEQADPADGAERAGPAREPVLRLPLRGA